MFHTQKFASRRSSLKRQRGISLIQTLLSLVIAAVVGVAGFVAYSDSERSASIQGVSAQVAQVIGNAKQLWGQQAYVGVTTAIAVGARALPQSTHTSATTANNKYSGAITLVDNNATTPGTALLTYANVPSEECSSIVQGTQALARQMTVAGTEVKPLDGVVGIAAVTTQCISAGTVPISWTIGRT